MFIIIVAAAPQVKQKAAISFINFHYRFNSIFELKAYACRIPEFICLLAIKRI